MPRFRPAVASRLVLVAAGSVILILLIVLPLPMPDYLVHHRLLGAELEDAAHGVVFALFTWLANLTALPLLLRWPMGRPAALACIVAWCVVLAVGTEVAQYFLHRDADVRDAARDLLGMGATLCAAAVHRRRRQGTPFARPMLLGLACVLVVATPVAVATAAYVDRQRRLPEVWTPDSWLLRRFSHDNGAAYPGLSLDEPVADWSAYTMLDIDIANPHASAARFSIRIHDGLHDNRSEDRYNCSFDIDGDARRTVHVPLAQVRNAPLGRTLDLRDIKGVIVFQNPADAARARVSVEGIRLVR